MLIVDCGLITWWMTAATQYYSQSSKGCNFKHTKVNMLRLELNQEENLQVCGL
jgi:hypothetical protein